MPDLVVIGAGPAGMMAAGTAAERGLDVVLIDGNRHPGRKLLLTGKGRCNLTNFCSIEETIKNLPGNGRFLTNALYRFSSYDTVDFFNSRGLKTRVERGNRVFPDSDQAASVLQTLLQYLESSKVRYLRDRVTGISKEHEFSVELKTGTAIRAGKVILATGGRSYPATGSTGYGYKLAKSLGHSITTLNPGLVPIECTLPWKEDLSGLNLKNIEISILNRQGKQCFRQRGEIEFFQWGLGGPLILTASSLLNEISGYDLKIDLKPALSHDLLDKRIQREVQKFAGKDMNKVLQTLLPSVLIIPFSSYCGIDLAADPAYLPKTLRSILVRRLKEIVIPLNRFRPMSEAIITRGGIRINEIDPGTMESKILPGLFFAGEIIDVDGFTGGFNLQVAWTTGYVAGMSC